MNETKDFIDPEHSMNHFELTNWNNEIPQKVLALNYFGNFILPKFWLIKIACTKVKIILALILNLD